jgi:hypothetical protein
MVYGDTPYMVRGGQEDYKRIFYSDQNKALTKPITIVGGFGVIPAGTLMGIMVESADRIGKYAPYVIEDGNHPGAGLQVTWVGATYTVVDIAVSTSISVTMLDSYRFVIGDHLASTDSDGTVTDLGAIVTIDRTTYNHIAVLTVTNAGAAATVAKGAWIWHQTYLTDPFTKATGILLSSIDTGVGEFAKGGDGTLVLSNCILYLGNLKGYCADAATDLGSSSDGKYLVLK